MYILFSPQKKQSTYDQGLQSQGRKEKEGIKTLGN